MLLILPVLLILLHLLSISSCHLSELEDGLSGLLIKRLLIHVKVLLQGQILLILIILYDATFFATKSCANLVIDLPGQHFSLILGLFLGLARS
jgi:hypothetical protein